MTLHIGTHVSIAGGVQNALDREENLGGNCAQVFVHSPRSWSFDDITDKEAESFREDYHSRDWSPITVHSNYLINLATPKDGLHKRSVDTLRKTLQRASAFDMEYVVFHPGSHTGAGVDQGIANIADGLDQLADDIPDNTTLLLENTAGAGTSLGRTADELSQMVEQSSLTFDDNIGICIDTCHAFAAGYDIRNGKDVQGLIDDFDEAIGWDNVPVIHLNDSKHPFDSEKDEHQHIGEGAIGEDGMEAILQNKQIQEKPLILETPVEESKGYKKNIEKARELAEN